MKTMLFIVLLLAAFPLWTMLRSIMIAPNPSGPGAAQPPASPQMKWWAKALIVTIAWIALIIGIGVVHTEVVLAGTLTEQQDEAISERYGQLCGIGIVAIWVFAAMSRKPKPQA